jgi:hypothetical protein
MPGGSFRDRGTFRRTGPSWTPSREPVAVRCTGWPACAASARFHRCAKTPTRPLLAPLSRSESRPRAPLRLLQVDVSTSTTTDHSNIPIRAVRGRDGCPGSLGSRLPNEAAAGVSRGQGSGYRCPTFPVVIARVRDFAPTPIAPGTSCRKTPPSPVWSDAVRRERCQRRAPLQGAPDGRAAWRRASAKRPSVDQPEVPSITRRSRANGRAPGMPEQPGKGRRLFHHRLARRGTPAFASDGSAARPEGGEPSSVDPPQRPRVTRRGRWHGIRLQCGFGRQSS